ncbi:MAG: hypothetical protein IT432_07675 [Phycisphaerales bacterium]|nr:hypothetical protein [Phycisphaerales bacterium]
MNNPIRSLGRAIVLGAGLLGAALAPSLLGGCTSSPWQATYTALSSDPLAPTTDVKIRGVSWERLEPALRELDAEAAKSDTPPEEWSADLRAQRQATLLEALQVPRATGSVDIIGRSAFKSTDNVEPEDGQLAAFARQKGANLVVYSRTYLGKTDKIVSEPVTTYSSGRDSWWQSDARRRRRHVDFSETSTSWVPMKIQADEHFFVAYFLKLK